MTIISACSSDEIRCLFNTTYNAEDVLKTPRQRIMRTAGLIKAAALESISPCEVTITIEDLNSCKKIISRVLAKGDERILLENGLSLPIKCIHSIEFA